MKPPKEPSTPSWRIFRRWGRAEMFVGIVNAKNAEAAIEQAILDFGITDREEQKRLVAHRREYL
jgi:hypothetical protein